MHPHDAGSAVVPNGGVGGAAFFVIASGEVAVVICGRNRSPLRADDYFGAIALIDDGPCMATIVATTDLACYGRADWDFRPVVGANGVIAGKLLQQMPKMMRAARDESRRTGKSRLATARPAGHIGIRIPPRRDPMPIAQAERELAFSDTIRSGARGAPAKRVQEWLTFHGFATPVDSAFGDATERQVRAFQQANELTANGVVGRSTWDALVAPLRRAVAPVTPKANDDVASMTLRYARQHLAVHPIEIGGDNCGPWVRTYMNGNEGAEWYWCAGFVTTLLRQACEALDAPMPVKGSVSCDTLAAQARERGRFVSERDVATGAVDLAALGSCCVFLARRTPTDWTHTGIAFEPERGTFSTIEGNTNDEGSRNGYEVCRRARALATKDFIRLS